MDVDKRTQLMNLIYSVSFAVNDINLYLDTHPCDQKALECYHMYSDMRKDALKEYAECYGPLTADMVTDCNTWTWVEGPWPWEGGC